MSGEPPLDKTVIDTHRLKRSETDQRSQAGTTQIESDTSTKRSAGGLIAWILALLLVLLLAAAVLFVREVHVPMRERLDRIRFEQSELQSSHAKLIDKNTFDIKALRSLENERDDLVRQLENKEELLADIQKVKDELSSKLADEMQKGEVIIKQDRGHLVVDLVDKILFETAEAELNERGKEVLKQVAESFRRLDNKIVQVGGHTDSVPISEKIIDRFPSNWELSTARATNVVRFLQDVCKIPGERLAALGFSQYRPVADNRTKEGRRRNRRIEVVLLPKYGN